ncbi:T9SS type A sorting domain-containing protein [Pseudozobellia thermophila]|uniref:Por secretion system C-terminal sorting domain-containing protein n=1 Tax=Pseudozobellia thermophila TaxID=192903 RepID=A0A1M6AG25_9FLAO|nr:T9SS type A sorting domain-containing protein [Pseudozobellia thermophila]SHI35425.1 Por secretion system C-terminal sorting domain-containing protein [Pseudozobellia thermophila]
MKHFYLVVTLFFISFSYGQSSRSVGDIEGFKLYPNPVTNGKVYISTSKNAPKQVAIYDVLGTKVLETKLNGKELFLGDLDAGVYVLRVYELNRIATRKLIVK